MRAGPAALGLVAIALTGQAMAEIVRDGNRMCSATHGGTIQVDLR